MSIHLNTHTPQPAAPKKGFWERSAEKMHEKDALTSDEYCTRKWTRKNNAFPSEDDKASAAFQKCIDGHRAHLALSAWLSSRYYF